MNRHIYNPVSKEAMVSKSDPLKCSTCGKSIKWKQDPRFKTIAKDKDMFHFCNESCYENFSV